MRKFASLEEQRVWEKQQREKYKATHIAWRERNKEKLRVVSLNWRLTNKEKEREYARKRYQERPDIRDKSRARASANCIKHRAPIDEWKKQGCNICGLTGHPMMFDAHHIDPTKKSFAISAYYRNRAKYDENDLEAELAKCVCLCANCHRLLHAGVINIKTPNLDLKPEYFI